AGLASFQRSVELDPDSAGARGDLAMELIHQGRAAEGVAELKTVVDRNPNALQAANNLVWILATSPDPSVRDPQEALRLAQLRIDPQTNAIELLDTLAAVHAANGDFQTACSLLDRALEASSSS